MKRILVAVGTLAFLAGSLGAQAVIGHISGRIVTAGNEPVAGVIVTVTGSSLLGTRSTSSDSAGRFHLLALPAGRYEVRARRPGFQAVTITEVDVRLGSTVTLPRLVMQSLEAVQLPERVITAAETGVDPRSVAARTVFDARQLDALPVDRNARSLAILAPMVAPSFYPGDEANIGGATGAENVWFVDGINITSPINGATSTDLPYNFIRQVEIRTTAAEADAANAIGGVMNVVTPTGGNEVRGELYGFFSGGALQGTPRSVAGAASVDTRQLYDVGAAVGGPVVRDRLWFFGAYNPTVAERAVQYGTSARLRTKQRQHLLAGKLSGILGSRTSASLTVLGDPTDEKTVGPSIPIFGQPASVKDAGAVEGLNSRRGLNISTQVLHQFSSGVQLELSHARSARRETIAPRNGVAAPTFIDYVAGEWSGGFGFAQRIRSTRATTRAAFSVQRGAHLLRIGAEYDRQFIDAAIFASDTTMGGFLQRVDTSSYIWFQFDASGRLGNSNPSVYLRHSWEIAPSLVVNSGLRWSIQKLAERDTRRHTVVDGLQPQFSIVLRPGGYERRRLFASYSRVADQLALWFGNQYGPGSQRVLAFPQDPRTDSSGGSCLQCFGQSEPPFGYAAQRRMRGLLQDEISMGFSTTVGGALDVSVRGVRRELRSIIDDGWISSANAFVLGNPGRGELSTYPEGTRRYDALELSVARRFASASFSGSYVWSRTSGNYTGLYTTELGAATAHASAQFDYAEQLVNGSGLLPNDRPHLLKVHGTTTVGRRMTVGTTLLVASGTALSEYGTIAVGAPYWSFVTKRGTAGRTPRIWDLGLRALYDLDVRGRLQPQIIVDVLHLGNPRRAVTVDQIHYTALDADGNHTAENPNYRNSTAYQPPMLIRAGARLRF